LHKLAGTHCAALERPPSTAFHMQFEAYAELMTDFNSAFIIAEQNHFHIWVKTLPA
jgi:hypothetical protein